MGKRCNIQALAEAMYKRECDYVGANHGDYCISENVKTLQSFEDEIERLEAEVERLRGASNRLLNAYDQGKYAAEAEELRQVIEESE